MAARLGPIYLARDGAIGEGGGGEGKRPWAVVVLVVMMGVSGHLGVRMAYARECRVCGWMCGMNRVLNGKY